MITRLIIRRFQFHLYRVLELDRVNTIVGTNDRGKSAIVRALRWLTTNKPRGSDFVQHGAPNTAVTAVVDGHRVTRIKGKDENLYLLDGRELGAVGSEVPHDIADILRLDEDINFQGQHDSPFWFNESSAEVSRQLNEVVDLSIIDTTLANLGVALRRAKTEREVVADRLTAAKADKESSSFALDAREDLERLTALESKDTQINQRHSDLRTIFDQARGIETMLRSHQGMYKDAQAVIGSGESLGQLTQLSQELGELLQVARECKVTTSIKLPDLSGLETLESRVVRVGQRIETVQILVNKAHDLSDTLQDLRKRKRRVGERLRTEIGDTCVLCGAPIVP